MNEDRKKLLNDVLRQGTGGPKESLRKQCLRVLNRRREKQRIHGLVVGRLRTKRRVRRFVRVALSAAALIALGSFIYVMNREPDSSPVVINKPRKPDRAIAEQKTPAHEKEWFTRRARPIPKATRYPEIEIENNSDYDLEIIADRSPYRDNLFAVRSSKRIGRITQLSSFAMTKYIRGHAKIDIHTASGLKFKDPRAEQLFFGEGIPVRWLTTRINFLPQPLKGMEVRPPRQVD